VTNGKESTRIPIDSEGGRTRRPTGACEAEAGGPFPKDAAGGSDVRVDDITYRVLTATLARRNMEQLSLTLRGPRHQHRTTPANFWDRTFRLEVDGRAARAGGGLNEPARRCER
jgi:hypothetical protein